MLDMPYAEGLRLLEYARDQEDELKIYARWVVGYQQQIAYDEFKNNLRQKATANDTRSADEILQEVQKLMEAF